MVMNFETYYVPENDCLGSKLTIFLAELATLLFWFQHPTDDAN